MEVPVRRTPWTIGELLTAYAEAWRETIGGEPSRAALAILAGQATLECGHGGESCFNHNTGNMMAFATYGGDYHVLRSAPECFPEGKVPAGWRVVESSVACGPGKVAAVPINGSRFRAYGTFKDGCADKLRLLDRQWGRSIVALQAATGVEAAAAFVEGLLGPPKYFSSSPPAYTSSVLDLAQRIARAASESDWPTIPAPPDTEAASSAHWTDARPTEVPNATDVAAAIAKELEGIT